MERLKYNYALCISVTEGYQRKIYQNVCGLLKSKVKMVQKTVFFIKLLSKSNQRIFINILTYLTINNDKFQYIS